jgi:hypothetical protein
MVGFIGTSLPLQSIVTAHNQWVSKIRSIPYWTTSAFSSTATDWNDGSLTNLSLSLSLSLMSRPTVSRPVCLGIKHPSGAYDKLFITVWQLRVCWYGVFSLTKGRVCRLQLLLALASAVILGSESLETRDHILLSQIGDFPFRHLLRLAGLRWRYSTPPPHGMNESFFSARLFIESSAYPWKRLVVCPYPWKTLLNLRWQEICLPNRCRVLTLE